MYPQRYAMVDNPFGHNTIGYSFSFVVWKGIGLCPLRVVIYIIKMNHSPLWATDLLHQMTHDRTVLLLTLVVVDAVVV